VSPAVLVKAKAASRGDEHMDVYWCPSCGEVELFSRGLAKRSGDRSRDVLQLMQLSREQRSHYGRANN
jgi:hypothetical protein